MADDGFTKDEIRQAIDNAVEKLWARGKLTGWEPDEDMPPITIVIDEGRDAKADDKTKRQLEQMIRKGRRQ